MAQVWIIKSNVFKDCYGFSIQRAQKEFVLNFFEPRQSLYKVSFGLHIITMLQESIEDLDFINML